MTGLDKFQIPINCPNCHFENTVTLKQVRVRNVVICRGCKYNLQLHDQLNTTRKAISSVQRAFASLEEQLSEAINIDIKL